MRPLFIFVLLLLSTTVFAQFQVGHRTITYNDPARNNRAIECEIYYPSQIAGDNVSISAGQYPVIVFGHGFAMQTGAYPNFWNEYVPQGYIMVFPNTEASFLTPDHGAFGTDLQFLVNEMQAQGLNSGSPFYQSITDRAAIMGHSMGGGASFLGSSGFNNVDCVVGLAPAETNPSAITAAANVTVPALIFSGSSDGVTPPADHHIPIYDGLGSSCKYFVSIQNGSHCYFASNTVTCTLGEIIPGSLPAEDQRQVTYAVLTPWFEYFLKDDCDAWDDFQTALSTESDLGTIISVCVNDAPVIADNNGTLESDQQPNYQWYLNGVEIPNETQQAFIYSQSGTYQVGTVNVGSCPVLSNEITVQTTGISSPQLNMTEYWNNTIAISSTSNLRNVKIDLYDVSGRCMERTFIPSVFANESVSFLKPEYRGIKFLRLQSDEASKVWKIF
jgi:predicted dienelactone hydrolase